MATVVTGQDAFITVNGQKIEPFGGKIDTLPKLLINPHDYQLFLDGKKTATSRYGNRTQEFAPGLIVKFARNDDETIYSHIRIVRTELKSLGSITDTEALAIGDYSREDAIIDFALVYSGLGREVKSDTPVTIIWFESLEQPYETTEN